jgi:soluble lytic murein transglycosylase-like protein
LWGVVVVDALASLPSQAGLAPAVAQCIASAAVRYQVPELLLHAIVAKEAGRTGHCNRNRNGSLDCGLAQINTVWFSHFARYGIRPEHIVHDACLNVHLGAYVLRTYYNQSRDWVAATASYNIGPSRRSAVRNDIGRRYAEAVVRHWWTLYRWRAAR